MNPKHSKRFMLQGTTFIAPYVLALIFSFMSFNVSACDKNTKSAKCSDSKAYSQERYSAARAFARTSLGLRVLKWSRCTNKVDITDNADADLTLIQNTLSRDGKFRFSLDVESFKNQSHAYIQDKINESEKVAGDFDKVCRSLESDYKDRYKKAKLDYFKIIKK